MDFWQLATLGGTMATVLGVFLTVYAMINNRTLKEESRRIREILLEESKHTREILVHIEQGQEEARKEAREARAEAAEGRREMADAIRSLGALIRGEGERTREVIRARPA